MRSGLLFGLLNVAVALWACWLFREQLPNAGWLRMQAGISLLALLAAFRRCRRTDLARRSAALRRRDRACREHAVSAHRRHALEG
jgi:predicted membrane-bound spermidine synthase